MRETTVTLWYRMGDPTEIWVETQHLCDCGVYLWTPKDDTDIAHVCPSCPYIYRVQASGSLIKIGIVEPAIQSQIRGASNNV